jgi:hypothetical protein
MSRTALRLYLRYLLGGIPKDSFFELEFQQRRRQVVRPLESSLYYSAMDSFTQLRRLFMALTLSGIAAMESDGGD